MMLSTLSKQTARLPVSAVARIMNMTSSKSRSLSFASLPSWVTYDPRAAVAAEPYAVRNMVNGQWVRQSENTGAVMVIPHPLNANAPPIFTIPDTSAAEIGPFVESLRACPKTGLHNPLKNPERYVQYGEITRKVCY
jgi:1-pyrroline-5-carboxylate dehydrogenase